MTTSPLPLFATADEHARAPLVLSYGMGVDSTRSSSAGAPSASGRT